MQPDPVDSTKMVSAADHGWDEQDQYESDKYKYRLLWLEKNLALLGKEERLDIHDELEQQLCKQQLEQLRQQAFLDSLQRKWETGEGLNRMVMEALEDLGKLHGLPQEEIERRFKAQTEHNIKEALERHMCTRWVGYFEKSLGMQGLQPLPDDLPLLRRQIERLRRQTLQNLQHELLLCIQRAYLRSQKEVHKFSVGVDTNNVFPSIYVPNSVRVQAQGFHTKMQEKIPTTVGSVGCAKGDESSALLAVPTSLHQQFLLNNRGGEGSDIPRSNHDPTVTSSTEANRVPLVHQLTEKQSQDKRKIYLSPKVDYQLESKHKPIQMEPDSGLAQNKAPPNTMLETKEPDVTIMPTMLFGITYFLRPSDVMPKFLESESPEPGTIHKYNHGSRKRSYSGPFNTSTNKKASGSITANPRPGEKGFIIHSSYAKGNRVRKNISVISRAGNIGGSSSESEGTSSTLTGGNNHHRETDSAYNDMPEVILDNQAHVHCTGNFNVLSYLNIGPENIVLVAANNGEMETFMSGSVHHANFELTDVHYCPDLGNRIIVSGSILDNDDYGYEFGRGKFTVKDLKNDTTVGEGRLVDGNYILDYLKISGDRTRVPEQPGLVIRLWNAVCSALHRLGLKY